jgi:hypothetical protein
MANVPTLLTSADLSASQTSGAPASVSSTTIIQANTFAIGNWLYLNGSTYALAKADSANTASVVGIVSAASSTQFTLTTSGLVTGLSGLTVGANYFLSATTAGLATTTEPTTTGYVSAPVGIATSATSIQVAIDRGTIVRNTVTTLSVGGDRNTWYPVVFNRSVNGNYFDFRITRESNQTFSGSGACNFRLYGKPAVPSPSISIYDTLNGLVEYEITQDFINFEPVSGFVHCAIGGYSVDPYGNRITVWLRGGRDYYLQSYSGDVVLETIIYNTSTTSFIYGANTYSISGSLYFVYNPDEDNLYSINSYSFYYMYYKYDERNYISLSSRTTRFNNISSGYASIGGGATISGDAYITSRAYVSSDAYIYGTLSVPSTSINARGYASRSGISGIYSGNSFNIYWTTSAARLYIDNTNLGNISVTSDYRIKKNIETQDSSAIDRIAKIRPVKYEFADYKELFKEDGVQREGFIAHELQEVIPSAVDGEKDAEDQIQSLKLDALCSVMVKAIQEQQAMIDALKAEVELLKNK